jgi:hypothetical protein
MISLPWIGFNRKLNAHHLLTVVKICSDPADEESANLGLYTYTASSSHWRLSCKPTIRLTLTG